MEKQTNPTRHVSKQSFENELNSSSKVVINKEFENAQLEVDGHLFNNQKINQFMNIILFWKACDEQSQLK